MPCASLSGSSLSFKVINITLVINFNIGLIVKTVLPVSWFTWLNFKEETMTDEEEKNSVVASFRRSFRDQVKRSASQTSLTAGKKAINN